MLVSVTILHRHGARGPGESELGPWTSKLKQQQVGTGANVESRKPIALSQWKHEELENITPIGHALVFNLGLWFAQKYARKVDSRRSSTCWRSSKSGRALESGYDFIRGFASFSENRTEVPDHPMPFEEDADVYFRPWKVFKEESNQIKSRALLSARWAQKAEENKDFLRTIYRLLEANEDLQTDLCKGLWSITYICCVFDCEKFWQHETLGFRQAVTKALSADQVRQVRELASWVWMERFLRSDFIDEMGGRLCIELLLVNLKFEVFYMLLIPSMALPT